MVSWSWRRDDPAAMLGDRDPTVLGPWRMIVSLRGEPDLSELALASLAILVRSGSG